MTTSKLTKRQRQILWLMNEYGSAAFPGGTRRFWHQPALFGGTVVYAYQQPEWHLQRRGLIEVVSRGGIHGTWYRLTEAGRRLCPKTEPKGLKQ